MKADMVSNKEIPEDRIDMVYKIIFNRRKFQIEQDIWPFNGKANEDIGNTMAVMKIKYCMVKWHIWLLLFWFDLILIKFIRQPSL